MNEDFRLWTLRTELERRKREAKKGGKPSLNRTWKKPPYGDPLFERFWEAWPCRVDRVSAMASWDELQPPVDEVIAGVERWKASKEWHGGFIPRAWRFLEKELWKEYPEPNVTQVGQGPTSGFRPKSEAVERAKQRNTVEGGS